MNWIIPICLFIACAALLVAEVFVPSGGLISICAIACVAGGISLLFNHSAVAGWIGVLVAGTLIPTVLFITYKIFPKTRFGKAVILTPPDQCKGDGVPSSKQYDALLGKIGCVITPLRPVGMCIFSGQRLECVAESGYVDTGKKIKVIDVESTQLTVRLIKKS